LSFKPETMHKIDQDKF